MIDGKLIDHPGYPIGLMVQLTKQEAEELFTECFPPETGRCFTLQVNPSDSRQYYGTFPDGVPVDFYALPALVTVIIEEYIAKCKTIEEPDEPECKLCGCECEDCACGTDGGGGCAECNCNNDPSYCHDCEDSPCVCEPDDDDDPDEPDGFRESCGCVDCVRYRTKRDGEPDEFPELPPDPEEESDES
jgi:hypothetical protein